MNRTFSLNPASLLLLVCLAFSILSASEPSSATITINTDTVIGPVNRHILGHNLEAADSFGIFGKNHNYDPSRTGSGIYNPAEDRLSPKVIAYTRQLGASIMRYPGGCLTHNFDWRKTIGPRQDRPDFTFGLNEFLRFCRATGANPLINVSTYATGPVEAAQLVEYLNAPATEEHPWAMRRHADGHEQPWAVTWFEIGNESDHGTHDLTHYTKHTPESYVAFFNQAVAGMKAIDPTIKIGAHLATGKEPGHPWDLVVLKGVKDTADYIAVHTYYVGLTPRDARLAPEEAKDEPIMQACMAASTYADWRVSAFRDLVRDQTGRDLPLAITEYNAGFVQRGNPRIPYRLTLGAALFSAEYATMLLLPQYNVTMANYWQYHHGYWGMLRKTGKQQEDGQYLYQQTPAFPAFCLLNRHLSDQLIATDITCPTQTFDGYNKIPASLEGSTEPVEVPFTITRPSGDSRGLTWNVQQDQLDVDLSACDHELYPVFAQLDSRERGIYTLSYEAEYAGAPLKKAVIGLGMVDSRGWEETQSACAAEGIQHATSWQTFTVDFSPLPDCRQLKILLRVRQNQQEPVTGSFSVRNIRITRRVPFKPYPVISATASRSSDGSALHLLVFNKHHQRPITTTIQLPGTTIQEGYYDQLTGPLTCTNLKNDPYTFIERQPLPHASGSEIVLELPPGSMSGFSFNLGHPPQEPRP